MRGINCICRHPRIQKLDRTDETAIERLRLSFLLGTALADSRQCFFPDRGLEAAGDTARPAVSIGEKKYRRTYLEQIKAELTNAKWH